MQVTVWDGDKVIFVGDLSTRLDAFNIYVEWRRELYPVKNKKEVWLTGVPPNRSVAPQHENDSEETSSSRPAVNNLFRPLSASDDLFDELYQSHDALNIKSNKVVEEFTWDQSQKKVIISPKEKKLLVSAGPGNGKTAVACKRVAHLIEEYGCNPNKIWLISFTRTAVAEIRARIASYLVDQYQAYSVKIATLDAHAWAMNSGFDEEASLDGSFESNIDAVIKLVQKDEDVFSYLNTVDHLIVDEAQDFVGKRADLVLEILDKLQVDAGVTVFVDEAQAIYGFSESDSQSSSSGSSLTLPQRIRQRKGFAETALTTIHRTSSIGLKSIFKETRQDVLEEHPHPSSKYHSICEQIKAKADFMGEEEFDPMRLPQEDSCFVLFRTKKEVLKASSCIRSAPHRIRMGNIPAGIVPWIGALLGGTEEARLKSGEFKALWKEREIEKIAPNLDIDSAWNSLKKLGGGTRKPRVDLARLRQNLVKQNLTPDLILPELGNSGPIVGTIHAAKGREAEHVHLFIPPKERMHIGDYCEEARVVFVGATRARSFLHVYKGFKLAFGNKAGEERVWEKIAWQKEAARVQIGCPNDIDLNAMAGVKVYEDFEDVETVQNTLRSIAGRLKESGPLELTATKSDSGLYMLLTESGEPIATLSRNFTNSLFSIGENLSRGGSRLYPCRKFQGIKLMDICTLVAGEEASTCKSLHTPWGNNGIILAPRILGYPRINFNR